MYINVFMDLMCIFVFVCVCEMKALGVGGDS